MMSIHDSEFSDVANVMCERTDVNGSHYSPRYFAKRQCNAS